MESIRSRIFPNSEKKTDRDYLNDFEDFFKCIFYFFFKIQLSPVLKKKKKKSNMPKRCKAFDNDTFSTKA